MRIYRGRLVDHVQLVVRDLDASRRFYEAVLGVLGVPIDFEAEGMFGADELAISTADSDGAQGKLTGPTHLAFQARDNAMVEAFYEAGLAAGGTDNGAPGERANYHPGYYAAFLLDPDGNNIEAVHHGAAKRSVASIEIDFEMPGQA
jgi:catechol 2,3-dioxygenase-like lactoylglutathione lyase family enzyme